VDDLTAGSLQDAMERLHSDSAADEDNAMKFLSDRLGYPAEDALSYEQGLALAASWSLTMRANGDGDFDLSDP